MLVCNACRLLPLQMLCLSSQRMSLTIKLSTRTCQWGGRCIRWNKRNQLIDLCTQRIACDAKLVKLPQSLVKLPLPQSLVKETLASCRSSTLRQPVWGRQCRD
jgi:hypothetical protein